MKNPIIEELRRIRDAHAKRHKYDLNAIAQDLMKLEPWMEKKTYTLHRGRLVPITSLCRAQKARPKGRTSAVPEHRGRPAGSKG